ncbi:helix-turn-helix domain-containing protein [Halotia branconii]|uniref:Helix-turn-helix transcriptional regulator n=1 Tax=Halotia branconii CENA392 TaxID=1539056 RepID=A0AAJ6NX24_9CYAN|nr:helix-turn-helix transcriptional regulator [Halotia branconii]WGV28073.1 helix-turn-helix transcriptional regulator [Halotia branconii CENA392]
MDGLPNDRLTKKAYGRILKNVRNLKHCSQEKLAEACFSCRRTIVDIETGKIAPNPSLRVEFAKVLSNPILEYFPQYSIGQFSQRLKIRFQHEKSASKYFLNVINQKDLDSFQEVFYLYKMASHQKDNVLMLLLDEYLHTRIMNAHPDETIRILVERYRQDYIEFFKIWIPQLNFNISLGQNPIHLNIFKAILEQNQSKLTEAIHLHLINSLNDIERIINALLSD